MPIYPCLWMQRLVVLGEYGLLVIRGQITILGATLSASETVYAVYAPSSHSLPVIRFLYSDNDKAEIRLHQSNSGLRSLRHLSPLFARLWNENSSLEPKDPNLSRQESPWRSQRSSFQIVWFPKSMNTQSNLLISFSQHITRGTYFIP